MSRITLEAALAQLEEAQTNAQKAQAGVEQAQKIIEEMKARAKPTVLKLPEVTITLAPGERYVGPVLDADGNVKHHLVLLADKPEGRLNWNDAEAWAEKVGGSLPTRQEQSLLFANCNPHLEASWHWSSESHENDASSAWYCYFLDGSQNCIHKSNEGSAVAVRRVNP